MNGNFLLKESEKSSLSKQERLPDKFYQVVSMCPLFTDTEPVPVFLNTITYVPYGISANLRLLPLPAPVTVCVIMGAGSGLSEDGTTSGRQSMGNNMWDLFVHRPYLYMQYGTDKESEVGVSRVDELLSKPPGQARQDYVEQEEVIDLGNGMMTYVQVPERLVFTGLYTVVNGITSLPIFALALLIIVLQF